MYFSEINVCDFGSFVPCELTMEELMELKLPRPIYLYFTIDNSPNRGTTETLDALKVKYSITSMVCIHNIKIY